jgi:hypothetical protein
MPHTPPFGHPSQEGNYHNLKVRTARDLTYSVRDFMFKLTAGEKAEVVANCDHLKRLKFSPTLPYAFTEHGAVMLANVIKSKRAIDASIQIVRAFIRLRQMVVSHAELARKLEALERKYDAQFRVVFDAIRELMSPQKPKQRQIGFERKTR